MSQFPSLEVKHAHQGERGDISYSPQALRVLQARRCIRDTQRPPPAQAASFSFSCTSSRSTNLAWHGLQVWQHSLLQQGEEDKHQNLRLQEEEEKPEPNLEQVIFAESRQSSSNQWVHAMHTVSLINLDKDLQFSKV